MTIDDVMTAVCAEAGVTLEEMRSKSRHPEVVRAREVFVAVAYARCACSMGDLAEALGRRRSAHSSISEARGRVLKLLAGRGDGVLGHALYAGVLDRLGGGAEGGGK